MSTPPNELRDRLTHYRQEHLLAGWDRLTDAARRDFVVQLDAIDLDLLRRLYAERDRAFAPPAADAIEPVPVVPIGATDDSAARARGEEALRRGEVAALIVAGGQGSRLGFEHPKGMYPVGTVSRKSLFQIHAEKVLALGRRHHARLPFLVMTSSATDGETRAFFAEHKHFGLAAEDIHFFQQGTMPALDLATGRLLLEAPGRLFLSPDGHGGTLTALAASGLLNLVRSRGIRHVFYFQVDNPLVRIADATFLGHHVARRAEVSSKVVAKTVPGERVGLFVQVAGRCSMIEYSDLSKERAAELAPDGRLRLWAGNPAIHLFDVEFLDRVTRGGSQLPFHVARKKVAYADERGELVTPDTENALKFERFIFDVLPLAERWLLVETDRAGEFAPLKNVRGDDSPETVARALNALAADWLAAAGVAVPRQSDGRPRFALEISPLFALDAAELATKVSPRTAIDGPRYFE